MQLTLALCLLSAGVPAQTKPSQPAATAYTPEMLAKLSGIVDDRVAKRIPPNGAGMAILVLHEGQPIHAQGYGFADIDAQRKITVETPFYIASVTKLFTATIVLMLVEEGKVALDDTAGALLPDLPQWAQSPTIRHFLSHTSGVPDYYDFLEKNSLPTRGLTNAAVIDLISKWDKLDFPPGTKWAYSNTGYVLLANIIEKKTSKKLKDVFAEPHF